MKYLGLAVAASMVFAGAAYAQISAPTGVMQANDATFARDVLSSATPVVVDFYADWCGPCRRMGPVVDHLSQTMGDKVKFVRVNIDASPATAQRYGISSIPSFGVFKGGRLVGSSTGAQPEQALEATINSALTRSATKANALPK